MLTAGFDFFFNGPSPPLTAAKCSAPSARAKVAWTSIRVILIERIASAKDAELAQ